MKIVFGINFVSGKVFIFLYVFGDVRKYLLSIFSVPTPIFFFFSCKGVRSCSNHLILSSYKDFRDIPNLIFFRQEFGDVWTPIIFLNGIRQFSKTSLFFLLQLGDVSKSQFSTFFFLYRSSPKHIFLYRNAAIFQTSFLYFPARNLNTFQLPF